MATRIGILTVSDTRSAGQEEDLSGPAMQKALAEIGFTEFEVQIVPDEVEAIQSALCELSETCAAVISTGAPVSPLAT